VDISSRNRRGRGVALYFTSTISLNANKKTDFEFCRIFFDDSKQTRFSIQTLFSTVWNIDFILCLLLFLPKILNLKGGFPLREMIGEFATNSVIGGEFADHFTLWKAAFRYPLSGFYDNISKKKRIVLFLRMTKLYCMIILLVLRSS